MSTYKSSSSPIFIGGLYKSGTSLLRAMLSRHSNIAGGLETFWFDLDFEGRARLDQSVRHWDGTRIEPLEKHIMRLSDYFDLDMPTVSELARNSTCAEEFIDRFMSGYAALISKKRWVEKTPANVLHIERIFRCWSTASFIHIVRDPRDVYSSNVTRAGKYSEPDVFARLWIKFITAYKDAEKSDSPDSFMEVRYEDLVLEPSKTMRIVLDFIHEPWEEAVAQFPGRPADFQKVQRITGKASATLERLSKPLVTDRVGAWKNELENPEKLLELEKLIEKAGFGDLWERHKYQPPS